MIPDVSLSKKSGLETFQIEAEGGRVRDPLNTVPVGFIRQSALNVKVVA